MAAASVLQAKEMYTMKLLWVVLAAMLLSGCAVVPYPYAAGPEVGVGVGVGVPVYRGGFGHRPYYRHGYYGRPYYRGW
jgi:hypothetical protein